MIVVVGAGMGGLLTAAILTRLYGKRVIVLDSNANAGGSMHVFKKNGVEFDVGLHYVGGMMGPLGKFITKLSGVEWSRIAGPHDVLILPSGKWVEFGDKESQKQVLTSMFGETFVTLYFSKVVETQRVLKLYYIGKLILPGICFKIWVYLFCSCAVSMMRSSAARELRRIGADEACIAVCCYHWADFGETPERMSFATHSMLVSHWWNGNYYPVGGSKSIVQGLRRSIIESSGKINLGTQVISKQDSFLTIARVKENNKKIAQRCEMSFDSLIFACGKRAASKISGFQMPPAGESFFMTYLCFTGSPIFHKLPSYNTWVMGGKMNHDLNMKEWNAWLSSSSCETDFQKLEDLDFRKIPMMFISFNCAKDTLQKKASISTVSLVCPVDSTWGSLDEKMYKKKKEFLETCLCERLFTLFPHLRAYEKFRFSGSPKTFDTYIGSVNGCIYGASKNGDMTFNTEDGSLISGADVVSAGVSGAAIGGIIAAQKQIGILGLPLLLNI